MQRVTLLRHAEALDAPRGGRDVDRALSDHGVVEARAAAQALRAAVPRPDLILASTARRTMQTAQLVHDTAFPEAPLIAESRLYLADAQTLLDILEGLGDGFAMVLLVAHNPGISEACARLAGDGRPLALPTAGWRSYESPYFARGSFSPRPG